MRFNGRKIMNEKRRIPKLTKEQVQMKLLPFGLAGLVSGVLISFFGSSMLGYTSLQQKIVAVKLVPQAEGVLKVDKANQCKKGGHPGCLLFKEDVAGRINFHLPGSKKETKDCNSPNVNEVITKIELTAASVGNQVDATKGVFNGNLPDWLKYDAFLEVDQQTGIVYEAPGNPWETGKTQVWLTNLNNHGWEIEGGGDSLSFWYQVTVTACEENQDGTGKHETWVTDPRGDNEGGSHP